jgi:hypothetical protein
MQSCTMPRLNQKDFFGGLAILLIGGGFTYFAYRLGLGTTRRMGAGYFPFVFGVFTMVLALATMAGAFLSTERLRRLPWRPMVVLCASIFAFVLLLPRVGLVPTVFFTLLLASMADDRGRFIQFLALAAGVSIGAWLIFVVGLGLPIRPFRNPF